MLAATRKIYKVYVADMRSGKVPPVDLPGWRQLEIAAATPVTNMNSSFRSDELVGTDVRSPQNEALGSVEDLVMSPKTDKIAYLVVARGGIFGIDEKHVPVPWEAFKISPNGQAARTRHHQERHGRRSAGEQEPIRNTRPIRSGGTKGRCLLEGAPLELRAKVVVRRGRLHSGRVRLLNARLRRPAGAWRRASSSRRVVSRGMRS